MGAVDLSFSDAALDLLDAYLLSDQSPPESMPLSVLDGFLTGIAIGPELVMPSEWLPYVWGGEDPVFDDQAQASAVLGAIMGRYNAILREIEAGTFEPLVWEAPDGTVIAADLGRRVHAWRACKPVGGWLPIELGFGLTERGRAGAEAGMACEVGGGAGARRDHGDRGRVSPA